MASRYNMDKVLGFCTQYFKLYPYSKQRIWNHDEEMQVNSKFLVGHGKSDTLKQDEVNQIHDYVIKNSVYSTHQQVYNHPILPFKRILHNIIYNYHFSS